MAVDPDVNAEFILSKILEIDPALIIQHLRAGIHAEALVAINNATEIVVNDADGEVTAGQSQPLSSIRCGEIYLQDADGNSRTITPTTDTIQPS